MKRKDAESLGDVLRQAIEESRLTRRFDEVTAINSWPMLIGPEIAGTNPPPVVKNGVMTIKISSSPLRQELNMQRSNLAVKLNELVGKDVIKEIKFVG